jgi:hypothetical protein
MNEFIDQELAPRTRAELEKHLEQCAECRKELRMLKLTCEAVRNLSSPPAPQDFLIKLRQRIAAEPRKPSAGVFRRAGVWMMAHPVMMAASFVMVFGGAFALGRFSPTPVMVAQASEMEAVKAWDAPNDFMAASAARSQDYAYYGSRSENSAPKFSLSPVSMTSGGAVERREPRPQLFLQTPTQLVINLLRNDPAFSGSRIYPIRQGAVVQGQDAVYRITISDHNFIVALKLISQKKSLPGTIAEAEKSFGLEIEKLPNPMQPAE